MVRKRGNPTPLTPSGGDSDDLLLSRDGNDILVRNAWGMVA